MISPAIVEMVICDSCGLREIHYRLEGDSVRIPYGWTSMGVEDLPETTYNKEHRPHPIFSASEELPEQVELPEEAGPPEEPGPPIEEPLPEPEMAHLCPRCKQAPIV